MKFSELHVISDLHLGGEEEAQIFLCDLELVGLINKLKARPKDKVVGLVINGDLVDFLAEADPCYFDPHGAIQKLDRIFGDPTFEPIFQALHRYVATKNRYLIIILGNHDIELALPKVRDHLVNRLCKGQDATRGRIFLSLHGQGWVGQVGAAKVLCIHGNEVDTWNIVDHEQLRRAGSNQLAGRPVKEVGPNAGTKLVIDVINDIKTRYPFVDLLKPEVKGVIPILIALDETKASQLKAVVGVAAKLSKDALRKATGFLSEDEDAVEEADENRNREVTDVGNIEMEQLLHTTFSSLVDKKTGNLAEELMQAADQQLRNKMDPHSLVELGDDYHQLGVVGSFWNWIRGKDKVDILLAAVEELWKDCSFGLNYEDKTFKRIDKLVGEGFDYIITGHTHLERSLARKKYSGHYYNSGTWAGLIQLTPEMLKSRTEFRPIFKDRVAYCTSLIR